MRQQAVNAGNAHVVQSRDLIAEYLRRNGCLLGNGNIRRAAGGNDDSSDPVRLRDNADYSEPCVGSVVKVML